MKRKINFIGIGVQKAGTSWLAEALNEHPDVYIHPKKEAHYFNKEKFYLNKYHYEWSFKNNNESITGDITPAYISEKNVPKRIFDSLGKDMKFLVIFRNPVDRAYSHYLHSKRDDYEIENFEVALELEVSRLNKYKDQADYLYYLKHSYVQQGLYAEMLERYLQYFSLDNFLFIHFEDELLKKRDLTISNILDFLEVDNSILLNTDIRSNPSSKERSKSIKKLMNKRGWFRDIIKFMVPSKQLRQIINNKIQRINITEFKAQQLSEEVKSELLEKYFRKDISHLEKILNKKMNW